MAREDGWFKAGHKKSVGHGRPQLPTDLRVERKQNQAAFIRLVSRYLAFTDEQMLQRMAMPDATQLEGIIQGLIGKAKEGDANSAKYLVETMTGKIPDSEEFSDEELRTLRRIKEVMDEQRKSLGDGNPDGGTGDTPEQKALDSRHEIPKAD